MRTAVTEYVDAMQRAAGLLRPSEIEAVATLLSAARQEGRGVFVCGNGGSAATASHLAVDLGKSACADGGQRFRVLSLTDNVPWLTALSNDEGYERCFVEQLRNFLKPHDLLIGISASGDSENVVRAFEYAREVHAHRVAFIGFDGGRLSRLATRRVWIHSHDYGIVESMHLFVCHLVITLLAESRRSESAERLAMVEPSAPAATLPTLNPRRITSISTTVGE